MQEASSAADPGRRPPAHNQQQNQQFAGVDLRRPKGYAAVAASEGDPCPRCASRDTKFCYYNNYNTSQPRHFCKGCRRYWTKGGTLRNVPVGGGTRRKPSSSSSPSSYAAAAAAADADRPPAKKKKPASSNKRRVVAPAPAPESAAAAATEGSSENTTDTEAAAPAAVVTAAAAAAVAAAADDSDDSLAHLLLQPVADDDVALGLGLSDFPAAAADSLPLFQWPAAFDLGLGGAPCWASAAGFAADTDPAGLFLNLP